MIRALLILALCAFALPAAAHKPSDSYLSLSVTDNALEGRWDIALRDLEHAIGLDKDQDGRLTWGEVKAGHQAIAAYAFARLTIESDEGACPLVPGSQLIEDHSDGAYSVLHFTSTCPGAQNGFSLDYRMLFDLDPLHRGLLQIQQAGTVTTAILSPENSSTGWSAERASPLATLTQFLVEGVWHIWIGFDHVLFLVTLLLPAVLRRTAEGWQAVPSLKAALWPVVKVVTAFTLAHSITLSLAALGVVNLPSHLVESVIAASVALAAVNNVWPIVTRRLWLVAFGFGLIHGFGFASVLADLGLPSSALLWALAGFNIGVELGQLAIVAQVVPLLYAIRSAPLYGRVALPAGSLAIAALALVWLVERSGLA
ncbi:MAG: HupE/UreJ family protein [Pseudomonadota bacterium]